MKTLLWLSMLCMTLLNTAFAVCDLTTFRWDCEISLQEKPTRTATSLVYCGNTKGYLTKAQFELLKRNQRDHINMSLMINGEYIDRPCLPAEK